jgi:general secretion pathway protein K
MNISRKKRSEGIALIIVMIVILSLGILAGGFAYSMKVEMRLARNTSFEPELEWLGRSGVELARYVLSQSLLLPAEPWDSLNQKWAGGPAGTNDALAEISLLNNELAGGKFSVRITDLEGKFNINLINDGSTIILERALDLAGADPAEFPTIIDSFLDWRDPDDDPHLSGTESAGYLTQPNPGFSPHVAKNGPIDNINELLMIRGITQELFWGNIQSRYSSSLLPISSLSLNPPTGSSGAGLVDLFTPLSVGRININTASAEVLQILPGIDEGLAQGIITTRSGLDGVDGTDDDTPFANPAELINVPGMSRELVNQIQRFLSIRSFTFEVHVDAELNQYRRGFVAVLRRNNLRDIHVLHFYGK